MAIENATYANNASNIQNALNSVMQRLLTNRATQIKTNAISTPISAAATPAAPAAATNTPVAATPATGKTYTVGGNYAVDNSAYAAGTDANAIALQTYDKQLAAYKAALQAGYDSQAQAIAAQAAKLKDQYNASRNDIYTNSRLSAIGNNERLAARGLAGNLYDYARSGTSESSRIAQDVAMRKSLAQQNAAEISANADLDLKLLEAQREADAKYAEYAAKNEESKIPYLMALANAANMSSGGGGGGGGYSYSRKTTAKKTSGKSGNNNNNSSGGTVQDVLIKAATAAAKQTGTSNKQNAAANAAANAIRTYGNKMSNSDASKAAALVSELNYKMSGMYK